MILQFSVENFLSIRERQTLDFSATSDKTYEEYSVVKIGSVRISKVGVIYGPNASGKSNLLESMRWLLEYMLHSGGRGELQKSTLTPFLMDKESRKKATAFTLVFFIGNVRYDYEIRLDNTRIYSETLYYYPVGRRAKFYERKWDAKKGNSGIEFGESLKLSANQKLFITSNCIPKATVLSTYLNANVERNDRFEAVRNYLDGTVLPMLKSNISLDEFANDIVKKRQNSKRFICEMLEKADFNISDLRITEEKENETEELYFTHKTPYYTGDLPVMAESEGTNRMYGLSALLYSMVENNNVLICDELDGSLHYDLFSHIIKTFMVNAERGQLIFSTHNLLLLDEDFIRRDMIFFCEKNESGATEVYRAKDFGLHKEVSILNAYRAGKLGAKPFLGSIFIDS